VSEAPVSPPPSDAAPVEVEESPQSSATPRAPDEHVKASPLARRIARERGVDIGQIAGTGPEGRVIAEDVENAAARPTAAAAGAPETAPDVEIVELTSTRKTIARRLTEAWQAPVFQLTVTADATELVATRERMVELLREGETKPTVSDVLTRIVASALVRHRPVNANFVDGKLHRFAAANVGLAVAAPSGLVVPVIRDADKKSVQQIAADRADIVSRARNGKLKLPDLEGGSFTISNLGMYGIEQFIAVLNPPQVAILAVGSIEERATVIDGDLAIVPTMTMTLTCDHRAIDGSEGAEFLRDVKAYVEAPALAL
jgi:pyruvate dehydrogenase E2 component (dihydrolipoamide acetyltransferase)